MLVMSNFFFEDFFFRALFSGEILLKSKARDSIQMNSNIRDIVVVEIGFRFLTIFDLTSEDKGRKSTFEKC